MKPVKILSLSLVFLVLLLSMSGCLVLSVHPLYFKEDLIFEPGLVGTWGEKQHEEDLAELWIFKQTGEKSYQLTIRVKEEGEGVFEAHLLKLGKHMFLDLYPKEPESGLEFYNMHLIPTHSFMRISLEGQVLRLAFFDLEWLQDNLEQKKVHIEHARKDEVFVLTAPTEKLQEFALEHVEEAFPFEEGGLRRFW
jgi:hypothetical protein